MLVNKIEYLSSGNVLLSYVDNNSTETAIKGFFPDSGVTSLSGNDIKISRQNGSDFRTFDWSKVTTLIGKSGAISPLPKTKSEFYKILFEEFFIDPSSGSSLPPNAAQADKQNTQIGLENDIKAINTDIKSFAALDNWILTSGNSIEYVYYVGVVPGKNPSGNTSNVEKIIYKTGSSTQVTVVNEYNMSDLVTKQTAS